VINEEGNVLEINILSSPFMDCTNPTTAKPDGQFHSLERFYAYQRIMKLQKKNGKLGKTRKWENTADYDEVLSLSLKYNFVTELTSLVVTTSNQIVVSVNDRPATVQRPRSRQSQSGVSYARQVPCKKNSGGVLIVTYCEQWVNNAPTEEEPMAMTTPPSFMPQYQDIIQWPEGPARPLFTTPQPMTTPLPSGLGNGYVPVPVPVPMPQPRPGTVQRTRTVPRTVQVRPHQPMPLENLASCYPHTSTITMFSNVPIFSQMSNSDDFPTLGRPLTALSVTGDHCAIWLVYDNYNYQGSKKSFRNGNYGYQDLAFLYGTAKSARCVMLPESLCTF